MKALSGNRWLRILGVAFVMYVFAHIDRANLAMAAPYVRDELGFTPAALGFATGLFFWGYIILQIPAGRLAAVWSPKKVLLAQMLAWSVVSFSTAFVQTQTQLGINRFVLGLAEGGVLTCTLVLIRNWSWFFGVVKTQTGSFSVALTVAGASLILSSLVASPIRPQKPSAP